MDAARAEFLPVPPPPPPTPFGVQGQAPVGNRCVTPQGICFLTGPVGAPCTCISDAGSVNGTIVP